MHVLFFNFHALKPIHPRKLNIEKTGMAPDIVDLNLKQNVKNLQTTSSADSDYSYLPLYII